MNDTPEPLGRALDLTGTPLPMKNSIYRQGAMTERERLALALQQAGETSGKRVVSADWVDCLHCGYLLAEHVRLPDGEATKCCNGNDFTHIRCPTGAVVSPAAFPGVELLEVAVGEKMRIKLKANSQEKQA